MIFLYFGFISSNNNSMEQNISELERVNNISYQHLLRFVFCGKEISLVFYATIFSTLVAKIYFFKHKVKTSQKPII